MLKIKDNVDLKQLEKFEFVEKEDGYIFESEPHNFIHVDKNGSIFVRTEDSVEDGWVNNFNKLVELIQADLVDEKEKENKI